jgi:integrase
MAARTHARIIDLPKWRRLLRSAIASGQDRRAVTEGVPVKVVQKVLGHSSVTVTMDVYSHVLPGMQEKAVASMDDLLSEHW